MATTPFESLETILRERLAGTLPGLDAQLRFMPTPPRTGWKPGEFPSDARLAAGLLLLATATVLLVLLRTLAAIADGSLFRKT